MPRYSVGRGLDLYGESGYVNILDDQHMEVVAGARSVTFALRIVDLLNADEARATTRHRFTVNVHYGSQCLTVAKDHVNRLVQEALIVPLSGLPDEYTVNPRVTLDHVEQEKAVEMIRNRIRRRLAAAA